MLRKTHLTKGRCRLPAVGTHGRIPSCAGTSTCAQGRISMRMTRRMGSTRRRWQRSHPWGPPALPQGWSTLSWAPALHSELTLPALIQDFLSTRGGMSPHFGQLWALLARLLARELVWQRRLPWGAALPRQMSIHVWAVAVHAGLPLASVASQVSCCMRDCHWNSTGDIWPRQL